jgi:glycosyltransferase involved in cell wall biosynthesis
VSAPRVFGALVVRDEVDIIRLVVLHHLAMGCERILVLDNGSADGTTTVLRRLAARTPLSWTSDTGPYRQGEFVTGLAQEAARAGADWILPLDADEFWLAPGGLGAALDRPPETGAVMGPRVEFIQRRDQRRPTPAGILTMTMRVAVPSTAAEAVDEFHTGRRSMFEVKVGAKLAFRATPELVIDRGGHSASGMSGPVEEVPGVTLLHAPLRSRACLARKAVHGDRLERAGCEGTQGWHVRHWARRSRDGTLDAEWAAHAYDKDGMLLVGTRRVPLIRDERLTVALRRWVRPPAKQIAARALLRSY